MAIDIGKSLQPEYTNYRTEVVPGCEPTLSYGEWDDRLWMETGQRALGIARPQETFPKQIRFKRGKKVFDFNGYTKGGITVSARLKRAIEDIEPGVHQFVPANLLHKDGTPYPDPLWYFTICSVADAVSPDRGGVHKSYYTAYPDEKPDSYSWTILPGGRNKLAVYKDRVAGRAAWCDRRYISGTFFSDALIERMRAEGMEGWAVQTFWEEV